MIKEAIATLIAGQSLTVEESAAVMNEIMQGEATPAQFAAFVVALRLKGETVHEMAGMARTMREKAIRITTDKPVVDTCGTGGDGGNTFNISTAAAFVAAGAGVPIAKHGNRAMSSKCGSADVLEALGAKIDCSADQTLKCLDTIGICFMFAPSFHPATKFAVGPRKEIGIRTVFNILGPLTNPAGASFQMLGVADETIANKMAEVLRILHCRHALIVHGEDGLDEITTTGKTHVYELKNSKITDYYIHPSDFGFPVASRDAIRGDTAEYNAGLLRDVLNGTGGAHRDIVLMNAAATLVAAEKAHDFKEGIAMAEKSIDNGQAFHKLNQFIKLSAEK